MEKRYSPEELAPMNCKGIDHVIDLPGSPSDYMMNPKLDGFRIVAVVEDGRVDFMTRGLKWQDGMLPHTEEALLKRFPPGTVLDGEITALRDSTLEERAEGKPAVINDFDYVQAVMNSLPERARHLQETRKLTYYCFDMMQHGELDVRLAPLDVRLAHLNDEILLAGIPDDELFQLTPYVEATQDNHDAFVHVGFEGTVMKLRDSTYQHGTRGKGWFKIKAVHDMDVVIVGYVPGHKSNFGKVGSLILAQPLGLQNADVVTDASKFLMDILKKGKSKLAKGETAELPKIDMELLAEHNMGVRACARGFDEDLMDRITAEPEAYFGRVISITHNGLMQGGLKVRHPQFHRFREDKRIEDVGWHHR